MTEDGHVRASGQHRRRLSRSERRRSLLEIALRIVREEGADRLTLGRLAERAAISKPVVYDHFPTRSALLIALYRSIDVERVDAFRDAMVGSGKGAAETIEALAVAYIACAGDLTDEFHAVGAALAGSEEKATVFQELLDNSVGMFVAVLEPHSDLSRQELEHCCVGLVGAGEALATSAARGGCSMAEAGRSFARLIHGGLAAPR